MLMTQNMQVIEEFRNLDQSPIHQNDEMDMFDPEFKTSYRQTFFSNMGKDRLGVTQMDLFKGDKT